MDVDVERIGERRHEDARATGALLVHVVRDDRLVLVLHQLDVHARFLLREHEPVAVVVVADVLVIQVGIDAVVGRALGLVPVIDHQVLAVGILRRHHQHHRVVENLPNLRTVLGGEPMDDVDDRLAVRDFRGVNGRVDQVERLAFRGELLRFRVRQPARIGQAAVDLHQSIEPRQVLRRADAQHRIAVAHRRLADLLVLHAIGGLGDGLEVLEDLRVAGELAVAADLEAEVLIRMWNGLLSRHPSGRQGQQRQGDDREAKGVAHDGDSTSPAVPRASCLVP